MITGDVDKGDIVHANFRDTLFSFLPFCTNKDFHQVCKNKGKNYLSI